MVSHHWTVPGCEVVLAPDAGPHPSLAGWIALNIDPGASTGGILRVFSRVPAPHELPTWREELLLDARRWYTAALELKGRITTWPLPDGGLGTLAPHDTGIMIERVARLLRFAQIVWATGAPVRVEDGRITPSTLVRGSLVVTPLHRGFPPGREPGVGGMRMRVLERGGPPEAGPGGENHEMSDNL